MTTTDQSRSTGAIEPRRYTADLPHKQPSVLIVDDFPDGREFLADYLGFRRFTVFVAREGAEAIALAREHLPEVVLMDLAMPGIDGWEATRQLKADPRTKNIIVIALTARALKTDEDTAREAGCDGFVAKPYDLAGLANALETILRDGRAALPLIAAITPLQKAAPA